MKTDISKTPITNEQDLELIRGRDPNLDYKRFYVGLDAFHRRKFDWENKYRMHFSIPIKPGEINAAVSAGMIPKSDLQAGFYYWGICRGGRVARWSGALQKFESNRPREGRIETLCHPEDDKPEVICGKILAADIFIPFYSIEPKDFEIIEPIL